MDERLQKALEFGNYTVTLNNQKKLLKEKFIDQCVFYTNGYKFKINQDLITYCKTLIDLGHINDVVLIDSNETPARIEDLQKFLDEILDIYFSNLNEYHTECEKIKSKRSIKDIIEP
tara:strand:+ start:813 stop:1163 length:351 start_codon:yes stop_codon:yes gene_type:complete